MEDLLTKKENKKVILLGNEAVIRGALESGVQFVSTYPGTPASEVGIVFFQIQNSEYKIKNLYFEFSTNEKTAMEAAMGSSYSGIKTLVAFKNFGANVAMDALLPFVYTGTKGPTVILIADDPSCHSSAQSEENTRALAYLGHVPILEPSDPQECKDFTKLAFKLSEKFQVPVIVRTTTRVSHQKAPVETSKLPVLPAIDGKFVKNPKKFVTLPPRVLEQKDELLEKIEKMRELVEKTDINKSNSKSGNLGIITSGVSYLYALEALKELKTEIPILKIGSFNPLPKKKIEGFIKNKKKILVVEELEPYLEREVNALAKNVNCKVEIVGKKLIPTTGELRPEIVTPAVAKFFGKKYKAPVIKKSLVPPKRFPQLCPGCPYWLAFGAVKKAVGNDIIFGGDIGCYMLAGMPPHNMQDYLSCMGSSIGIAHGIKKVSKQKLITFIGDGTFFHAGIPALINTVFNGSNPLIILLNNETTAMTGHQPHPGNPIVRNKIIVEDVVKACGVKNLKVIDPVNQKEFIDTVKKFLNSKEVSVIISRRSCIYAKKYAK